MCMCDYVHREEGVFGVGLDCDCPDGVCENCTGRQEAEGSGDCSPG